MSDKMSIGRNDFPKYIGAVTKNGTRIIMSLKGWVSQKDLTDLTFICESKSLQGAKRQMTMSLKKQRLLTDDMIVKATG